MVSSAPQGLGEPPLGTQRGLGASLQVTRSTGVISWSTDTAVCWPLPSCNQNTLCSQTETCIAKIPTSFFSVFPKQANSSILGVVHPSRGNAVTGWGRFEVSPRNVSRCMWVRDSSLCVSPQQDKNQSLRTKLFLPIGKSV